MNTDGKWLIRESAETLGTPWTHWRWWERKYCREKCPRSLFLGTTKIHSLGLPFKSSNSKAESSSSHSQCRHSFTRRAMSRSLLKRFCTLNALLMGINLLISFQCRKSQLVGLNLYNSYFANEDTETICPKSPSSCVMGVWRVTHVQVSWVKLYICVLPDKEECQ